MQILFSQVSVAHCCRSVAVISEVTPVLAFIREHASELIAVGEVGLDFSPHVVGKDAGCPEGQALRQVQQEVFRQQILLATELGLPVNVHSRSAGNFKEHEKSKVRKQ